MEGYFFYGAILGGAILLFIIAVVFWAVGCMFTQIVALWWLPRWKQEARAFFTSGRWRTPDANDREEAAAIAKDLSRFPKDAEALDLARRLMDVWQGMEA